MKKWIIVILLIIVAFVSGLAIGYVKGLSPRQPPPISDKPGIVVPAPSPTPITGATITPPATRPPAGTPAPSPTAVPVTPPGIPPPLARNVRFDFALTNISGAGFTRTVTAQLANTGTADAHNTWAKVEVFSQGSRIQLNGTDFLRVDVGTLKAKETVTKQADIQFSLFDGLKIAQVGGQFVLTITSDENTQAFNYDYKP